MSVKWVLTFLLRRSTLLPHSKWKLEVLNLRDMHHDFWNIWARIHEGDGWPQVMKQKQSGEVCPNSGVKKHLKVWNNLELTESKINECATYLLQWAQHREDSIHLSCRSF